jgi:hypothetical protein
MTDTLKDEIIALTMEAVEKAYQMGLTAGARAEREAVCRIVTGLCISDNNAEEINQAIRARGTNHG